MSKHCTLYITLKGISPAIWRRVSVPAHWSLGDLHQVIQITMPWDDEHLHAFTKGHETYSSSPEYGEEDEWNVDIQSVLPRKRSKLSYTYDFGDTWIHEIVSEGVTERSEDHAVCLAGARAAPPEEIGGVWGYEGLLEDLKDPEHAEDPERLEWFEEHDPEAFDIETINASLAADAGARSAADDDLWTDELVEEMAAEYDAGAGPSDDFWEYEEDEQAMIIEAHHRLSGAEVPLSGLRAHCIFHCIAETQLRDGKPKEARGALRRLLDGGLDRHEAIHAMAAVNAGLISQLLDGDKTAIERLGPELASLTVESWRAREAQSEGWEGKAEDALVRNAKLDEPQDDDPYEYEDSDDMDFGDSGFRHQGFEDPDRVVSSRQQSPKAATKRKKARKAQRGARKRSRR